MSVRHDLEIVRGQDARWRIRLDDGGTPIDPAGYAWRGEVRVRPGAGGAALASFSFGADPGDALAVLASLSDTATAALPAGALAYDWWATTPGGDALPLLGGRLTVRERVTAP